MLSQPTPASSNNGLMRQKSMFLLGKLLRTKEPDIDSEIENKKVSAYHRLKYLCVIILMTCKKRTIM